MSLPSATSERSRERELRAGSRADTQRALVCAALLCAATASSAHAQTWSGTRTRPLLRQIVSVDATGEASWPYGREDVANDGLAAFAADEAGTDLRTVYAAADAQRLWLRAYVAAQSAPPAEVVALFFADTDDRDATGGPAFGQPTWPAWTTDPTPGGYERALGVRGDGSVLGVWSWDTQTSAWKALKLRKNDVRGEAGRDEDPIRIGAIARGYVQADLVHGLSGLTARCAGNLFVRVWHDAAAPRAFGDDDPEAFACEPPLDENGDPVVLRSVACDSDADCPNDGRCRDGVCLFAYACTSNADCRPDERCAANACVKVVDTSCNDSADCKGLVCDSGSCVACSESGARACAGGLACSPNGSCVNPSDVASGGDELDGGVGANGSPDAGAVRGGAYHCATAAVGQSAVPGTTWLWMLACTLLMRRRSKRHAVAACTRKAP